MPSKLFISIAVSEAEGLPRLPGVWNSARDLSDWAAAAGYDVVNVSDEGGAKVDVETIGARVSERLSAGLDRIVVYFAGHGFSVPPDQYLILSDGPDNPRERITRNGFRDMLGTYAPKQISFITDACRVMQPFRGLADSVIAPTDGELPFQTFDGFYATQDGQQAFAFQAKEGNPELCVFSWVLHRALTFQNTEACDPTVSSPDKLVVTSGSLAKYLFRMVPIEASARDVWQKPDVAPGFIRPDDIYCERIIEQATEPYFPPAKGHGGDEAGSDGRDPVTESTGANFNVGVDEEIARPLIERVRSEWRAPFMSWARDASSGRPGLVVDASSPNITVSTEEYRNLPSSTIMSFLPYSKTRAIYFDPQKLAPFGVRRSQSVLVTAGEISALVPVHQELWTAVRVVDQPAGNRLEAIGWGSPYGPSGPGMFHDSDPSPLEVLKGLVNGTINASDIKEITDKIRVLKHEDPLRGIVAAYLYDSVGDVDNIRRMCIYYDQHGQDVPFDIALLARAPLEVINGRLAVVVPKVSATDRPGPVFAREATEQKTVGVAGVAPLLRSGWAKLPLINHHWYKKLVGLTEDLTESPLACFSGERARQDLTQLLQTPL